jgi:hypothetical protein
MTDTTTAPVSAWFAKTAVTHPTPTAFDRSQDAASLKTIWGETHQHLKMYTRGVEDKRRSTVWTEADEAAARWLIRRDFDVTRETLVDGLLDRYHSDYVDSDDSVSEDAQKSYEDLVQEGVKLVTKMQRLATRLGVQLSEVDDSVVYSRWLQSTG